MDKILIADDDRALRGLLKLVALRCGFQVDTASHGREAMEKLEANSYLIAVVDLMMPLVNGYEIVQCLAGRPDRPAVLVVTAMADAHLARLDSGIVHSIIRKPFDIEMVATVLTELAADLRKAHKPVAALAESVRMRDQVC